MTNIKTTIAFAVLTSGLSAQTTAPASAKDIHELPDFVVTGSLWESDLTRTTASVTALDSERLAGDTQHFEDLINAIPNLTWTGGTSRPRYFQIRGIGENSQFEGETPDSSIRFLVDDLDFTGLGGIGNLFDVQQVEVLRGPQAGAYGVNAAGGVIKIVTNEPTSEWSGQVEGTIGEDNLISTGFAIGGPLLEDDPERLTFRFSTYQLQQDGFRDNQFLGKDDTNERDELNTHLKLHWIANEDWQWDGTLFYAEVNNGYDEWSLDNTRFDTYSDEPGRDEQKSIAGSIRGTWTGLQNVNVTTVTNYGTTDLLYSYDNDWTSGNYDSDPLGTYDGFIQNDREHSSLGQELRFDSVEKSEALGWIDRWTLGTYYNQLKEDTRTQYNDYGGSADADYTYKIYSYSFYGQVAHDFSTDTRLLIGFRSEHQKVDIKTNRVEDSGDWYDGTLTNEDSDQSSSLWGGKITLEHNLAAEQLIFTSFTRGYKAAGANGGIFREAGDPLTYDDETLYNFEVGFRSGWLDATVISQVTAFYQYRNDPQLRDSGGSGGFFHYFTDNYGKAEHFGLEAEATWLIANGLSANLGLGLLKTTDNEHDELANAPTYTFSAQLNYQADNGCFANLSAQGSDEYYESNSKDNRDQRVRNAFVTFNGSIGYKYQNWTFTVWGKNLFDEAYEKRIFYFDNYDGQGETRFENPADPQQFGVTLNYEW
jgi:outer membrane receptor protein involved in Fe transport